MKLSIALFNFIFCVFILASCKELYNDTSISSNEDILVVEGSISNDSGPFTVKLTKSLPFNTDTNVVKNVTNAKVSIEDDAGIFYPLQEKKHGIYVTQKGQVIGTIGKSYRLNITTLDNLTYLSSFRKILPPPDSVRLYAEIEEETQQKPNINGGNSYVTSKGISLYVDVTNSIAEKKYYKFEVNTVEESSHLDWRSGRPSTANPLARPIDVYCWVTGNLTPIPNVEISTIHNSESIIKKHDLGFLSPDPTPVCALCDPNYYYGWISNLSVSTIQEESYTFYQEIADQLNAKNSIFDPIASQLAGNIKCISDSTKKAGGYFDAVSTKTFNYIFRYNLGDVSIRSNKIPPVRENIQSDCKDDTVPDFWQSINK
jgi:hypothetical protein